MSRTYYDILQVNPDATADEIKEAYRTLAWQSQSEGGQERLKEVNTAYAVLSSPQRRAEYDAALVSGEGTGASVGAQGGAQGGASAGAPGGLAGGGRQGLANTQPQGPTGAAPSSAEPAEGPGFHPFLRLFGFATQISYWISRMRYYYIPLNLVLGVAAAWFLVMNIGNYREAPSIQAPHTASIEKVVKGQETGYVSVVGKRSEDVMYEAKKNGTVTKRYYSLYLGSYVLMVEGENLPETGIFTGMLRPTQDNLQLLIKQDSALPANKNLRVISTVYLDSRYKPTAPAVYLWLIIGFGLAIPVLLIPPLFGYSWFRRGGALTAPVSGGPAWPVPVLATGRFVNQETGKKSREAFVSASLVRTGNPDRPLEVWFDRAVLKKGLVTYSLAIPAGSTVEWGYAYGAGKPAPAVLFRTEGRRSLVTVRTEEEARQIAALFASGNLGV